MLGEAIAASEITARGLAGDRAYALVDVATHRAAVVRSWGADLFRYRAAYGQEPVSDQPAPAVQITDPEGATFASTAPGVDARLSATFGRALSLLSHAMPGLLVEFPAGTLGGELAELTEAPLAGGAPAGTFFDVTCVHLMATSTLEHLQGALPQGQVDVRRFRPNILVSTSGAPFVENSWVGRRLAIGDQVVLRVTMSCPRCVNVTMPQTDLPRNGSILREIAQQNMVDLGDIGTLACAGAYAEVVQTGWVNHGDTVRWLD
jgi:uncharacterized protein YcbX